MEVRKVVSMERGAGWRERETSEVGRREERIVGSWERKACSRQRATGSREREASKTGPRI